MTSSAFITSTSLIESFIRTNIPNVKRISKGMISLMELFLRFKRGNIKIKHDAEVFIPVAEMKKHVHKNYTAFREACFLMKGYHNRLEGRCDRIVGYTESFDALFIELLKLQKKIIINNTGNLGNLRKLDNVHHNFELLGNLHPGANVMNYTQTDSSARYYIWLQNLTKDMKSEIYSGYSDLDIVGCFPNIFYKEILKEQCNDEYMMLMVADPEFFLEELIKYDVYNKLYPNNKKENNRSSAKIARSRLFHPSKNGRKPRKSGVDWFDNLQQYIIDNLTKCGITDAHMYFTTIEQRIIGQAIEIVGKENVVLLMHDGLIVKSLTQDTINNLYQQTGYAWKVKVL